MTRSVGFRSAALLALAFWAAHGIHHLVRGEPAELLWTCNVAAGLVAIGCWRARAGWCAVAAAWLVFGDPLWLLDVATGGELLWTSPFVHVGSLAIAVWAIRRLGVPRGFWKVSVLGSILVLGITRLVAPSASNVNLVFAVQGGYERVFPSHTAYLALLVGASAVVAFGTERALRRLFRTVGEDTPTW